VRNEAEHITECIQSVLQQSYPAHLFEVIMVDDYSTDPTIRHAKMIEDDRLKIINLMNYFGDAGEYIPNKKKAITIGIKNAKGKIIVTTDGDCIVPKEWLTTLINFYKSHEFKFITSPVFMAPPKNFVGLFQQIDVISMMGITGGTIANHYPTMCNGANLLFEKSAFEAVEGFKGNIDIPTGDDIFLMQKIEAKYQNAVGFCKSELATVQTKPEYKFSDFVAQRVRWTSKSTNFQKGGVTLILTYAYIVNLMLILLGLLAFNPTPMAWLPVAVLFATKFFIDFVFNAALTHFFKRKILLFLFPIFEICHVFYVVAIGVLGLTGKYSWKDRRVG
jgi:cellulose synthase/poly-beta-1,6-N-acetylglucosamine synthase-like glycosyltransferase